MSQREYLDAFLGYIVLLALIVMVIIFIVLGLAYMAQVNGEIYPKDCLTHECYTCGPLDEEVCILGDKK